MRWTVNLDPYPVRLAVELLQDAYVCQQFIIRNGAGMCASNRQMLRIEVTLTARDCSGTLRSEDDLLEQLVHELVHALQDLEKLVDVQEGRFDSESEAYTFERMVAKMWPKVRNLRQALQIAEEMKKKEKDEK